MSENVEQKWVVPAKLPTNLAKYCDDLTLQAYNGLLHPSERDENLETLLLQILSRKRRRSPILVGYDTQSEQNIIEGTTIRIAKGTDEQFTDVQIVALQIERLLNSNQVRSDFNKIIEEIYSSTHPIALYIKDIHRMITYPDKDLFDHDFRIALRRKNVQFICSTTQEIFRQTIEVDSAINRSLRPVPLQ